MVVVSAVEYMSASAVNTKYRTWAAMERKALFSLVPRQHWTKTFGDLHVRPDLSIQELHDFDLITVSSSRTYLVLT